MEENYKLSHLRELEAESIHIIREVAAEFENPVMLYSIGKDSSVMVRLAEKAFYPGKVPFPLMHIDSKWKFREMIEFRDQYAKEHGWNLIVESNMEAFNAGVGPFTHGSKVPTDLLQTRALLEGRHRRCFTGWINTGLMPPLVEHVVMRKSHVPKNVYSLFVTVFISGILKTSVLSCGIFIMLRFIKEKVSVCFH